MLFQMEQYLHKVRILSLFRFNKIPFCLHLLYYGHHALGIRRWIFSCHINGVLAEYTTIIKNQPTSFICLIETNQKLIQANSLIFRQFIISIWFILTDEIYLDFQCYLLWVILDIIYIKIGSCSN